MPSAIQPQPALPGSKLRKAPLLRPSGLSQGSQGIIDIRQAAVELNIKEEIYRMFNPKEGPRRLPHLLLYSSEGLQLFEQITYLDEYYLTNYEIQVLKRAAAVIAKAVRPGSMLVELGSGNLRKVRIVLEALEAAGKPVDYYALDLSEDELRRTLAQVPPYQHVRVHGLLGTYDDGLEWLKRPDISARPKCIFSLGSSIGNFQRDEAAQFLKSFSDVLQPSDTLLIGLDSCTNPSKVYHAYNDQPGVTHRFNMQGLKYANDVLGFQAFDLDVWQAVGEYVYDDEGGRHQAFVTPRRDVEVLGSFIKAHERIQIEQSLKYSEEGMGTLWNGAGLFEVDRWMTEGDEYGLHLLTKASTMPFSFKPSEYARHSLPSLEDWDALWQTWDVVTQRMMPRAELLEQPIKLRNACIFYLGHIPTFLDIQLTKTTGEPLTEPASYCAIFERGVDPDVDNPEQCHAHSAIPDEWPAVEDVLQYQQRVRSRLARLYSRGVQCIPRDIGRAIFVSLEHEIMHLETLLYMMLQSDKTLPPPQAPRPDFEALAKKATEEKVDNEWFTIPEQRITIGLDDPENDPEATGHFGWDNEKPMRKANVHSFQAKGRPITNEEYAHYLYATKTSQIPAGWVAESHSMSNGSNGHANGVSNGHGNGHYANGVNNDAGGLPGSFLDGKFVRTVYGPVPLKQALCWPIFASYDELAGCAAWMGGRIPTMEEAKSIYTHVDNMREAKAERKLGKTVPAVNGHLANNGVEETPPSRDSELVNGGTPEKESLFVDLTNANVGFKHWHPVAVTSQGNRLAGQAEMGGVWEWTSSPLTRHEGFEPMTLYPQYTADFFDGKHNIVLGGSWSTHPRIAGRKSFINWYQRNYPYAWAGARLVRDL